ncbi:restriction endonuclease subunit S [Salmonella enterica subsp. enterica serovar Manchester]|uniref:restriction endonuclease subunit S n=1 Tax=Salmonella enterica TaxID=28901 RepID=UPI00097376CF|nr:restriction endonuclease subunit S [Salmonella enterica]EAB5959248.1 restriction endonuclease subunit S [Salmonella enterica subsp. enterica serovar Manchester]APY79595.1 restriction endonuclease subunit S [Salmonella enterica subsp. enterica serovar Manchester str. ST278]EAW1742623.1 restriction endonuclease subunit S [Salmonella enterica subsp. enterica]EBU6936997.1 restriction endonuclease subunit S [Salmonella enterica subsp. enterica serovar Manchester]EBX3184934.1 restriction endonucl
MSGGKLPEGWVDTQLGNIVDYGKATKRVLSDVNDDTWVLELEDIEKESSKLLSTIRASERPFKSTKNSFKRGDVLYGKLRPYLNKIIIAKEDGVCTTEIIPLCAEPSCCNKYIFYWLKSSTFQGYVNDVSYGVNMPRLGTADGLKAPLRLAPLAEQKIIAEKLDTLLAQIDSTKARLEQIPQILKRFRQAVLAVAVNGKLADKQDGNNHWQEQQLSHVASHIVDCPHSTPKWSSEGKYCVRTTAFSPFYLDLSNQGYVDEETYQNRIQRLKPEPDDILYSREGTIGVACQIPKGVELCLGQRMVLIRASAKISSKYLAIVLNSNHILKIVRSKTMGSTAPRINMSDIKSYPIPLPPLQEQHEIVRRVEQLFACADTIEKQVNSALTRVNSLTQSILAKAFRGELTAQWRAENPDLISGENSAAALLEKIKAERAASGGKKTSRKKA